MKKGLVLSEIEGFTLIELIVVIGIMAILTSIGLAYFNNFNEEKKITAEVSRLVDVLQLARSKSMANDYSPMPTCTDFSGYQLEITQIAYNFVFCCSDCSGANRKLLQSHTLYSTVTVDAGYTFLFRPLTGQTIGSTLKIGNNTLNKCAQVDIQNSGLISSTDLDVCH